MTKERPWVARLYPERNSSLYVRVLVWPTKRAFLAHMNEHHITRHGNRFGNRTEAACAGVSITSYRGARPRRSPCVAVVNFRRDKLGIGVVTHEFFHATLRWAHRVRFRFPILDTTDVTAEEERITYVHGNLCREFMVKGLARGGVYSDRDVARSKP